jgi:hypothetical protein
MIAHDPRWSLPRGNTLVPSGWQATEGRILRGERGSGPELGTTRLTWLRRGATVAMPEALKAELGKLEFLRRHGADHLDLSRLSAGRRRCSPRSAGASRLVRSAALVGGRGMAIRAQVERLAAAVRCG